MKLKAIDVEKPTEEIVGGQRKTAKEECKEDHRPSRLRSRDYLLAWELDLDVAEVAALV